MKILVSACLLGRKCKYNGGDNLTPAVADFCRGKDVVPVCPEMEAGMPCPRAPVEICHGRIVDRDGNDLDGIYRNGVARVMNAIRDKKIDLAILKSRSPTCGVHEIYDGTFSEKRIKGEGLLTKELRRNRIPVVDEEDKMFGGVD